jgi:thermitase
MLYHFGLLFIQICLFWRYFGKEKWNHFIFWPIFFLSVVLYFSGLTTDTINMSDRLFFIGRDFLTISLSAAFLFIAIRYGRFIMPASLLLVIGTAALHYYLPGKHTFQSLQLEHSAEVIMLVNNDSFQPLKVLRIKSVVKMSNAFYPERYYNTDLDEYLKLDVNIKTYNDWKSLLNQLRKINGVVHLEPNNVYDLNLPNNKLLDALNLKPPMTKDPLSGNQWALDRLNILGLNEIFSKDKLSRRKKGLLVILDTGIDKNHEDLLGHFQSISSGADMDPKGHGTHCAGIASAVTGNNLGIASLNSTEGLFNVSSIRVLNAAGYGTKETIVDGIIEAVDKGATVISLSLGGPGNPIHQRIYKKAVSYAASKGCIVVVAAGNSNRNAKEFSPANVSGVIAVSAVDENLSKASFSNKVSDIKMAVAAPGVNILSTLPHNQYGMLSGTSMATPYVASLIAIMKSVQPTLSAKEAFFILSNTGLDTKNTLQTGRFIQPKRALENILKIK